MGYGDTVSIPAKYEWHSDAQLPGRSCQRDGLGHSDQRRYCRCDSVARCEASGTYLITTGINATNLNGLKFGGTNGLTTNNNGQTNTVKLICNTGAAACLDLSGTTGAYIHDLTLTTVLASSKSQVGIIESRTTVSVLSADHFHNVYLDMKSLGTGVNSGKGSIGIYNYAAEQTTYDTISVLADTPLVLSDQNTLALTLAYATLLSGVRSMTGVKMVDKVLI